MLGNPLVYPRGLLDPPFSASLAYHPAGPEITTTEGLGFTLSRFRGSGFRLVGFGHAYEETVITWAFA